MLSHVRQGGGTPLVLLHGIGSQRQMWAPVLELLSAERDVVAVDLPGFGASAPLARSPTIAAMADAVADLVAQLDLGLAHLAGNSLGGAVALELARTGRARSATALSPVGFARGREIAFMRGSLVASRRLARALQPVAPALLATPVGRTALLRQLIGRPWQIAPSEAIAATRNLAFSPGFEATLPHVASFAWAHGDLDLPVTIAWGTRDWLLIARQADRARRLMPRARHVRLDGCGHVPTWDDPAMVAGVLLAGSRE